MLYILSSILLKQPKSKKSPLVLSPGMGSVSQETKTPVLKEDKGKEREKIYKHQDERKHDESFYATIAFAVTGEVKCNNEIEPQK